MIQRYLDIISNQLMNSIPEFTKSVYLARIDDDGRVLVQSDPKSNEFKWAGLSDNDGNYFYIRHQDSGEIAYEESSNGKMFTCNMKRINARYQLRIVANVRNMDPYYLEQKMIHSLMETRIDDCYLEKFIGIFPRKSQIDSIAVLKDESPKPKPFDKNLMFVAIDFDLVVEFTYL